MFDSLSSRKDISSVQAAARKKEVSDAKRKQMAKDGTAMPDGSFPIENKADLLNAIKAQALAKDPAAAKAHIIQQAKALGCEDELPDGWVPAKKSEDVADLSSFKFFDPVRTQHALQHAVKADTEARSLPKDDPVTDPVVVDKADKAAPAPFVNARMGQHTAQTQAAYDAAHTAANSASDGANAASAKSFADRYPDGLHGFAAKAHGMAADAHSQASQAALANNDTKSAARHAQKAALHQATADTHATLDGAENPSGVVSV